jgi:hypothetical protein
MKAPETGPNDAERTYHRYVTHNIPWYVHALWIVFWIFAVSYVLIYFLPSVGQDFAPKP